MSVAEVSPQAAWRRRCRTAPHGEPTPWNRTLEVLFDHRSVRRFLPEPIGEATLATLIAAAHPAPIPTGVSPSMRLVSRLVPAVLGLLVLATPAGAASIKLGVTAGPHAQIAEALVPVAKAKGLDVQVVEFSDGSLIDPATQDGSIDANGFQHTPYLDQQNKDRKLDLVAVGGRTVLLPMAGYSRKVKSIADLPVGAQISIPSDPTNGGRALKLLETTGLIKLPANSTFKVTELDIVDNPKKVKIIPMETAQLPRSLEDVDFSVITSHFALAAGLVPKRDAILVEGQLSEYYCLLAVKREKAKEPWVQILVDAYKSPEVKAFIDKKFDGNVVAGW